MSRRTDELIYKAISDELDYWGTKGFPLNPDKIDLIAGGNSCWIAGFKAGIKRTKTIVENIFIDKDLDNTDD
jgi:hypothetical protein